MSQSIEKAAQVATYASVAGISLIGLGKVALFLKANGSIVSTALLSGVAAASAAPLSKYTLSQCPLNQETMANIKDWLGRPRSSDDDANALVRYFATGAASFLATTLLAHRMTNFISGYPLSLPKRVGLGLVSGVVSGVAHFGAEAYLTRQMRNRNAMHDDGGELQMKGSARAYSASESRAIDFVYQRDLSPKNNVILLLQQLSQYGPINESAVAEVLEKLEDIETIVSLVNALDQQAEWSHSSSINSSRHSGSKGIILSPFVILAHFRDREKRNEVFARLSFMVDSLAKDINSTSYSLSDYPAAAGFSTFSETLRDRMNAETVAMIVDHATIDKEALLQVFDEVTYRDMNEEMIKRSAIEAAMKPKVFDFHKASMTKDRLQDQGITASEKLPAIFTELQQQEIPVSESSVAGVLSQLSDQAIVGLLNAFNSHARQRYVETPWVHIIDSESTSSRSEEMTLSPFVVLAHFKDLEQRDRIFKLVDFVNPILDCYKTEGSTLERFPAAARINEMMHEFKGRIDTRVYAMFFAQIEDDVLRKALLDVFNNQTHWDINEQPITSSDIALFMAPTKRKVPSLSRHDAQVAALAGIGALAVTGVIVTALILSTRLAKGAWSNYPTVRGIVPTALTTTAGFFVGKVIAENSELLDGDLGGYIGALALGILGTPKAAKYILKGQQVSYWHGAGFTVTSVLAHYLALGKSDDDY